MGVISRGFGGRSEEDEPGVPPGQYLTDDFPVLSAGPTPRIDLDDWRLDISDVDGSRSSLTWPQLMSLPIEDVVQDIHCVTRWSKLGTRWRGVSLDDIIGPLDSEAEYALVRCYGGYSTNLPLEDLLNGKAWVAFEYEGEGLRPEHGGPARLLVPHLYLWKSAKWINGIELREDDQPGFWETLGYHDYGDPWREQRYAGD
ncbi:sulfite oxidase-like oxidoreductase [Auraticoccus monumenti]|uniref:Oxidoreductase molybdopterin binding domain-containing protein n=1 Tax=Auraticoccus monumenti TaxID=675864 RepID=A0A1G7BZ31_9ACTN|nr:sulfite oxidase-like oxidoreductase [Auraticoccus monumenti]SDE32321.1 Oxidoreductase molybdopterin binding domain-containing protein [Auraticoccus monumenti]